ncbi:MAG: phosphate/phosphite/phosphonate ABC transporter substrate-binding protein [Acidobacteriota bacterium]
MLRPFVSRVPLVLTLLSMLALVGLTGCGGPSGDDPSVDGEAPQKLVLGLVPAREADVLIENTDELSEALSAELGVPVESFVPQDYTGLVEAMGSGRADIGLLPPFAAMLGNQRYGIEPVLISVRRGEATYKAQWMTTDPSLCAEPPTADENGMLRCDGPIEGVRGRLVAFTDPTSTSGHLFPALQLLDAGINPEQDIQSVFIGGHDAAAIAVYNGDVEVGVAFEDVRRLLRDEYPDIGEKVIVFGQSPPIPNDGVTVRGDLPPETRDAIRRAFLAITERDADKPQEERVLWRIYEIDGFVAVEPGLYDVVKRAFREMRDKIDLNS